MMACLIKDYKLAFQNCISWLVKTQTIIKACSMLVILDDEIHFFGKAKKVEKVIQDKTYKTLQRSIQQEV